jgi:predicted NBD/HSP70 family sugar kinase
LVTDLVSASGFVAEMQALLGSWQNTAARKRLVDKGGDLALSDIVAVAESGDRLLQERLEELGNQLGMLAANLANLFAPEKIVLTGEVLNCSTLVRRPMERTFREWTLPPLLQTVHLEDGILGGFAGALGVAWLGFAKVFPEDEDVVASRVHEQRRRERELVSLGS